MQLQIATPMCLPVWRSFLIFDYLGCDFAGNPINGIFQGFFRILQLFPDGDILGAMFFTFAAANALGS